ncbi:hypothetical protein Pmani_006806 [Petrolisthes manimaculis]|uniref:Uncharacterized protein n=1 Tax=Petrolisthes manimaculis TaxID=1843537 RepID=A0AAE1Q9X8_9EUCA|nr:hypothetical protein Pmani_006806 [Petrolisthes manimaculis]
MLREAGEVVFMDATGCVDQLNTAVIPFLCAGPAGPVPQAVLFTFSQDEGLLWSRMLWDILFSVAGENHSPSLRTIVMPREKL